MHFTIHAAPTGECSTTVREVQGQRLTVWEVNAADLPPLGVTFEQVAERLSTLPRMFFEPDGSFVWVSSAQPRWQLDGQLQDRGPALDYVELKGTCAAAEWEKFLTTLGWPGKKLLFQLVRAGIFLDEPALRQLLLVDVANE